MPSRWSFWPFNQNRRRCHVNRSDPTVQQNGEGAFIRKAAVPGFHRRRGNSDKVQRYIPWFLEFSSNTTVTRPTDVKYARHGRLGRNLGEVTPREVEQMVSRQKKRQTIWRRRQIRTIKRGQPPLPPLPKPIRRTVSVQSLRGRHWKTRCACQRREVDGFYIKDNGRGGYVYLMGYHGGGRPAYVPDPPEEYQKIIEKHRPDCPRSDEFKKFLKEERHCYRDQRKQVPKFTTIQIAPGEIVRVADLPMMRVDHRIGRDGYGRDIYLPKTTPKIKTKEKKFESLYCALNLEKMEIVPALRNNRLFYQLLISLPVLSLNFLRRECGVFIPPPEVLRPRLQKIKQHPPQVKNDIILKTKHHYERVQAELTSERQNLIRQLQAKNVRKWREENEGSYGMGLVKYIGLVLRRTDPPLLHPKLEYVHPEDCHYDDHGAGYWAPGSADRARTAAADAAEMVEIVRMAMVQYQNGLAAAERAMARGRDRVAVRATGPIQNLPNAGKATQIISRMESLQKKNRGRQMKVGANTALDAYPAVRKKASFAMAVVSNIRKVSFSEVIDTQDIEEAIEMKKVVLKNDASKLKSSLKKEFKEFKEDWYYDLLDKEPPPPKHVLKIKRNPYTGLGKAKDDEAVIQNSLREVEKRLEGETPFIRKLGWNATKTDGNESDYSQATIRASAQPAKKTKVDFVIGANGVVEMVEVKSGPDPTLLRPKGMYRPFGSIKAEAAGTLIAKGIITKKTHERQLKRFTPDILGRVDYISIATYYKTGTNSYPLIPKPIVRKQWEATMKTMPLTGIAWRDLVPNMEFANGSWWPLEKSRIDLKEVEDYINGKHIKSQIERKQWMEDREAAQKTEETEHLKDTFGGWVVHSNKYLSTYPLMDILPRKHRGGVKDYEQIGLRWDWRQPRPDDLQPMTLVEGVPFDDVFPVKRIRNVLDHIQEQYEYQLKVEKAIAEEEEKRRIEKEAEEIAEEEQSYIAEKAAKKEGKALVKTQKKMKSKSELEISAPISDGMKLKISGPLKGRKLEVSGPSRSEKIEISAPLSGKRFEISDPMGGHKHEVSALFRPVTRPVFSPPLLALEMALGGPKVDFLRKGAKKVIPATPKGTPPALGAETGDLATSKALGITSSVNTLVYARTSLDRLKTLQQKAARTLARNHSGTPAKFELHDSESRIVEDEPETTGLSPTLDRIQSIASLNSLAQIEEFHRRDLELDPMGQDIRAPLPEHVPKHMSKIATDALPTAGPGLPLDRIQSIASLKSLDSLAQIEKFDRRGLDLNSMPQDLGAPLPEHNPKNIRHSRNEGLKVGTNGGHGRDRNDSLQILPDAVSVPMRRVTVVEEDRFRSGSRDKMGRPKGANIKGGLVHGKSRLAVVECAEDYENEQTEEGDMDKMAEYEEAKTLDNEEDAELKRTTSADSVATVKPTIHLHKTKNFRNLRDAWKQGHIDELDDVDDNDKENEPGLSLLQTNDSQETVIHNGTLSLSQTNDSQETVIHHSATPGTPRRVREKPSWRSPLNRIQFELQKKPSIEAFPDFEDEGDFDPGSPGTVIRYNPMVHTNDSQETLKPQRGRLNTVFHKLRSSLAAVPKYSGFEGASELNLAIREPLPDDSPQVPQQGVVTRNASDMPFKDRVVSGLEHGFVRNPSVASLSGKSDSSDTSTIKGFVFDPERYGSMCVPVTPTTEYTSSPERFNPAAGMMDLESQIRYGMRRPRGNTRNPTFAVRLPTTPESEGFGGMLGKSPKSPVKSKPQRIHIPRLEFMGAKYRLSEKRASDVVVADAPKIAEAFEALFTNKHPNTKETMLDIDAVFTIIKTHDATHAPVLTEFYSVTEHEVRMQILLTEARVEAVIKIRDFWSDSWSSYTPSREVVIAEKHAKEDDNAVNQGAMLVALDYLGLGMLGVTETGGVNIWDMYNGVEDYNVDMTPLINDGRRIENKNREERKNRKAALMAKNARPRAMAKAVKGVAAMDLRRLAASGAAQQNMIREGEDSRFDRSPNESVFGDYALNVPKVRGEGDSEERTFGIPRALRQRSSNNTMATDETGATTRTGSTMVLRPLRPRDSYATMATGWTGATGATSKTETTIALLAELPSAYTDSLIPTNLDSAGTTILSDASKAYMAATGRMFPEYNAVLGTTDVMNGPINELHRRRARENRAEAGLQGRGRKYETDRVFWKRFEKSRAEFDEGQQREQEGMVDWKGLFERRRTVRGLGDGSPIRR